MVPMTDTKPLHGKIAFVTGSARRIGRAIALELARSGADVVVHARAARAEAEAVAQEIRDLGQRAMTTLGDVSDEAAVRRMFSEVAANFGGMDIMVNNAAVRGEHGFLDMSLEEWRRVNTVIMEGSFLCSREALKQMIPRQGGTIINIGGVSAHIGAGQRAHVAAAKAGLLGLTRSLAVEFASAGVRVNCVVPGQIGGPRSVDAGPIPKMPRNATTLVGRMGRVEEVAHCVRSLCVPDGAFITGQTIHVNGGMYMN
jgi:3-oxoacyl-[acyl-carrier protein] reductase